MPRKYAQGPLARVRKAAGYSQVEAARLLGLKTKSSLYAIEAGRNQPCADTMRKMAELYRVSSLEILKRAVETFEQGTLMRRHMLRKMKVMTVRK